MSRASLFALQRALVDELTAVHHFGGGSHALAAALAGLDAERVALLARLTQAKRLGKIARVLPATFSLLGAGVPALLPEFVAHHPLQSANGYWNAVQFYRFVRRRQRYGRLEPAHTADLAACELAMASVSRTGRLPASWPRRGDVAVRRAPGSVLRRCAYDVRALLCGWTGQPPAAQARPVHLAVVAHAETGSPRVLELEPAAFALVRGLRRWQTVHRALSNGGAPGALLRRLVSLGLLEVRRA